MKNLIKEFEEMKRLPLFEIQVEDEFYIYNIQANNIGLEAGTMSNTGFYPMGLICEWEENVDSLDYYLNGLYEICMEDAIRNHYE